MKFDCNFIKEEAGMVRSMTVDGTRIGKPSMTDLPFDLGKRIIDQILETPKPDFSNTEAEVRRVKDFMRAQRQQKEKRVINL